MTGPDAGRSAESVPTRRVTIQMTVEVELEVDDFAVSDWKGYTIRDAFADQERWVPDCPPDDKWLSLAEEVGIRGRGVSSIDGWADFPDHTVKSDGWPHYSIEAVYIRNIAPTTPPASTPEEGTR